MLTLDPMIFSSLLVLFEIYMPVKKHKGLLVLLIFYFVYYLVYDELKQSEMICEDSYSQIQLK